jgi:hypothetical protein
MPGNGEITAGSCKVKFCITPSGATPFWWYHLDDVHKGDVTLTIDATGVQVVPNQAPGKFAVVIKKGQRVVFDWL